VGKGVDSLRTPRCKRGPLLIWTDTSGEASAVRCKLGETIEQPCSDVLAYTPKVCKGTHLYNGYLAIMDDHDSWGMCTTSVESKTIIKVVLTVMSGMDPHMISGTRVGLVELGLVSLVGLVDSPQRTLRCDRCPIVEVLEFA
jgi:hypothetical protein